MNRVWNEVEVDFVRKNADKVSDAEGARKLSELSGRPVSIHSWRKQRQKLALKKAPGRGVCKIVGADATPPTATPQGDQFNVTW